MVTISRALLLPSFINEPLSLISDRESVLSRKRRSAAGVAETPVKEQQPIPQGRLLCPSMSVGDVLCRVVGDTRDGRIVPIGKHNTK
jgi:hypothetical protein